MNNKRNYHTQFLLSVFLWHALLIYVVYINGGDAVFHSSYWYLAVPTPVITLMVYAIMFFRKSNQESGQLIIVSVIIVGFSLIHNKFIELCIWAV